MYLISQNGRLVVNMDNVADIYISSKICYNYKNKKESYTWEIKATYPAASAEDIVCVILATYKEDEEEKCVKQFEVFKKALLAGEKFFDFSKEVE